MRTTIRLFAHLCFWALGATTLLTIHADAKGGGAGGGHGSAGHASAGHATAAHPTAGHAAEGHATSVAPHVAEVAPAPARVPVVILTGSHSTTRPAPQTYWSCACTGVSCKCAEDKNGRR